MKAKKVLIIGGNGFIGMNLAKTLAERGCLVTSFDLAKPSWELPGVDYIENEGPIPFMFNLTPEQQEFYKEKFQKKFDEVREKYFTGNYDLVVLDEVIDAYNLGTIQKEQLLEMMDKRPEGTELVITGHQYGMDISALTDRADYVTKFVKEKHPFDLGMPCRKGIEE